MIASRARLLVVAVGALLLLDRPTVAQTLADTPAAAEPPTSIAPPLDTPTPSAVPATPTRPPLPTATLAVPVAASPPAAFRPSLSAPMTARDALPFAAGGALAIVAMWIGARIAGAGQRGARRRARRTLATAMLLELRRLDAVLRRTVALDHAASFPSLEHPIMEAGLRDLTLFQTTTAARIAQFHGALRGIQHEVGDYRDNPLRWAGRLGELHQLIKARATAACRAVPELMKALEREGGVPPPQLPEAGTTPTVAGSDLPPPPFGAGDRDDWTL